MPRNRGIGLLFAAAVAGLIGLSLIRKPDPGITLQADARSALQTALDGRTFARVRFSSIAVPERRACGTFQSSDAEGERERRRFIYAGEAIEVSDPAPSKSFQQRWRAECPSTEGS